MNNRHSSDFRRVWLWDAYLALLDVYSSQRGQLALTDNNFENQLLCYVNQNLVIENTALLTKTFFVFTLETLRLHYILSYSKYSKYSKTNNKIE